MSPTTPKKIMISSVMQDFTDVREKIASVITRNEHVPIYAEAKYGSEPSKEIIEEMVNNSDCYIGIFHQKWGWIPPKDNPEKLSVTALEYKLAKERGIPILIFVSELEKESPLQEFLNKIGNFYDGHWFVKYKDVPDLAGAVGSMLNKLIAEVSDEPKPQINVEEAIHSYTTKNINQISDNIGGTYEKPNDFDAINQETKNQNLWIVGERGIGKSVVLKKIIEEKITERLPVLFIRSEDLLLRENFLQVTKNEIGLSIAEIISQIKNNEKELCLIIDSVEALPRNEKAWTSFSAEIIGILQDSKVHTVLTIRKSDFHSFPQFFSKDWGKTVELNGLDDEQISRILKNIGVNGKVDKQLYPILKHPFYLSILASLVSDGKLEDLSSLSTQSKFLKAHYDLVVRNSKKWEDLAPKRVELLSQIALKMFNERRFKIPNFRFPSTPEFNSLRTDGIIVDTENFIQFFHQIYFDFIMSMIIIEKGRISKFLIDVGNETFLRSTIRFTLSYLHDQDLDRYLENIQSLLTTNEVDDYWKNVTIGFIANLHDVSGNEYGLIEELLNADSDLQKYFLDSVIEQKNPYWYSIWKDTLLDQWSSDGEFQHAVLLTDYIKKSVDWLS